MYVCMCICVCVFVYVAVGVYVCVCAYLCVCVCVCVCGCVCVFMCVYVFLCVCVCGCVCVFMCVCVFLCVCVCVCRRCIARTFIRHITGFREQIVSENPLPRTLPISTLHVRIGLRRHLAKFGKRPLKTCFSRRSFNPSLRTTDLRANLRMCGIEMN